MLSRRRLIASLIALGGVLIPLQRVGVAADDPVVTKASAFVDQFERDYVRLVSQETYAQRVQGGSQRLLVSEVAAAELPGADGFVFLRSATSVDGRIVSDSDGRLDALLRPDIPPDRARVLALRDESSRFNLGTVHRNLNDPTLALRFLGRGVAQRFSFQLKGTETLNGVDVRRVDFREIARPTLIRNGTVSVPASGSLWIDTDGVVRQTELRVTFVTSAHGLDTNYTNLRTVARVTVQFAHDNRLALWVDRKSVV